MAEILVAGITALGLIIVAAVGERTRQHAKATREQVQNSHTTNLRDDIDRIHFALDRLADVPDRLARLERAHHRGCRRRGIFTRNH
jgi:C4-dicarboxylate-specific signal transduction histidine kinase